MSPSWSTGSPIAYVESGTKDVHRFFEQNKWLGYASLADLEGAYDALDLLIALRSGLVAYLWDDPKPTGPAGEREVALGIEQYLRHAEALMHHGLDDFSG